MNDATWLADLMGRGLIRGSFVPDAHTQHHRFLLQLRLQQIDANDAANSKIDRG